MGQNKRQRAAEGRRFLPQLEALEERCCPSVFVAQDGDTLHIQGDDAPDSVAIVATGSIVTVNANGFVQTFFGIEEIEADLEGGNDRIALHLNGFGPGPVPNNDPALQAAFMQNMAVVGLMAQQDFNLMAAFVGFGDRELDVEIDGEDGFDALFISSNAFRLNQFELDTDDVEFRALVVPMMTAAQPGQPGFGQPLGFITLPF